MTTPSISQKLSENLAQIIAATPPGERLLSEPMLARQLGVSRATLREAMRSFESQGLIRRRQGSGTYVTHPSTLIDSGLEVLESIESISKKIGLPVTMGICKINQRQSNEAECQALEIDAHCQVVEVSRVIEAENRPVAYLIDILPIDILTPEEIDQGFSGSVLDLILKRGDPELAVSRTNITAVVATPELARALEIQRGDVLLYFNAYLYALSGRVVDYSFSYFLPGYFHFHVVRRIG
jgi:GntR family transcriptional regulator